MSSGPDDKSTVNKTIGRFSSLRQLLPNNAVFTFQVLATQFTNRGSGKCCIANKVLTISLIIFTALLCFFFSFIDSFKVHETGESYFGIATPKGFFVINMSSKEKEKMDDDEMDQLNSEYKIRWSDWIHAFFSIAVFGAFAISDANVVNCLLPNPGTNLKVMLLNFPLALTSLASLVFFLFPTTRIGFDVYGAKILRKKIKADRNTDDSVVNGPSEGLNQKGPNGPVEKVVAPDDSCVDGPSEGLNRKGPNGPVENEGLNGKGPNGPVEKVASLEQLLPSNTVFAFQVLAPPFTNSGTGKCYTVNKCFTIILIIFLALLCFFFSFTDTFKHPKTGKHYFGIATRNGFFVFHKSAKEKKEIDEKLKGEEFKIRYTDWIHAIVSLAVFGAFGINDGNVLTCLLPKRGANLKQLFINLPLALTFLASFIFFIWPSTRTEIGYGHKSGGKTLGEKAGHKNATPSEP